MALQGQREVCGRSKRAAVSAFFPLQKPQTVEGEIAQGIGEPLFALFWYSIKQRFVWRILRAVMRLHPVIGHSLLVEEFDVARTVSHDNRAAVGVAISHRHCGFAVFVADVESGDFVGGRQDSSVSAIFVGEDEVTATKATNAGS